MSILFVQPFIPVYRLPFFLSLASKFGSGFKVIHSEGDLGELTPAYQYSWSDCIGRSIKIGSVFFWQKNLISFKVKKNDIVVISGNPRYLSTIIFVLKVRLLGGKIAWWGHYRSSTSNKWRMNLRLKLMKIANGIIFYTQDEVKEYLSMERKKEERPIVGLNNGIDIKPIKDVRKKYNASTRRKEILFIGRTSEKSNFSILLEALKYPSLKNITLNVVGNDKIYQHLYDTEGYLAKKSKINWYGRLIKEQEISNIANRCQIFVYPGAVGLSLIHAMAYGLPCLVHSDRLKHMPEIAAFKTGKTGLTFKRNDPHDLANKLSTMISNVTSLNKMSHNCIETVEKDFNIKSMTQNFVKFIKELK